MANGIDPQKNHVRWIVTCMTLLGLVCAGCGAALIWKGYHGDLLIGGALAAISALGGFLGAGKPTPPAPDITVSAQPPKVEVAQQPTPTEGKT